MRAQLVCVVLLALASCSLCSDSEEEIKALEADLLTNMYTSKINRAKLPYWKMTLLNVCTLVNNMNNQVGEAVEVDEEDLVSGRQFPAALDGFSLEAMLTVYQLQKVCQSRAFQHWELHHFLWWLRIITPNSTVRESEKKVFLSQLRNTLTQCRGLYDTIKEEGIEPEGEALKKLLQQDVFDLANSSQEKEIMKRKNPYILKRQLHVNKARRPYILKRSSFY